MAQLSFVTAPRTVIGLSNVDLQDGANALLAGDWEAGVSLTLRGLDMASGPGERKIAHANLCAGYLMVNQPDKALEHCDWVLERYEESAEDIRQGQMLRPNSVKLKATEGMLREAMQTRD